MVFLIPTIPFDERRFHEYSRIIMAGSLISCIVVLIILVLVHFSTANQYKK